MDRGIGKETEAEVVETPTRQRKRQRVEPFVADYRPYSGRQLSSVLERRSSHKDHWDRYYRNNTVNGYRDRHYILREFHELRDALQQLRTRERSKVGNDIVWMEAGCGVGNALLPILDEYGDVPGWKIIGFDISSVAIDLLLKKRQSLPKAQQEKLVVKVLDPVLEGIVSPSTVLTSSSAASSCCASVSDFHVTVDSVDFVSMIFVLCSIPKDKHELVLHRVAQCMKPGAIFFLREYCVDDHAASRFSSDRKIGDHTYIRTNGTLSHFFGVDEVRKLFSSAGLRSLELFEVDREVVNRKESLNMRRRFIQGRFIKMNQDVDREYILNDR